MVQIPIKKTECDEGKGIPEWSMIELQGDLELKLKSITFAGQYLGDLHYTEEGTAAFIIGHSLLFGKVVNLEKPLVLMEKERKTSAVSGSSVETSVQYTIRAVVKRKIIFKTRPRPIVTNMLKPAS